MNQQPEDTVILLALTITNTAKGIPMMKLEANKLTIARDVQKAMAQAVAESRRTRATNL
jgi:hypothetical protein